MSHLDSPLADEDLYCGTVVNSYALDENIGRLFQGAALGVFKSVLSQDKDVSTFDRVKAEAKKLNWLPLSVEKSIGDKLHASFVESNAKVVLRSQGGEGSELYVRADDALARVLAAVGDETEDKIELVLLDDSTVDVRSAAGGYIYLTSGAMASDSLEFLLAHEVSHILRRHHTQQLQVSLIDSAQGLADLKGLLKSEAGNSEKLIALLDYTEGENQAGYSGVQIKQSDACAARIVKNMDNLDAELKISQFHDGLVKVKAGLMKDANETDESRFIQARIDNLNKVLSLADVAEPEVVEN